MFARVTTSQVNPDQADEATNIVRDSIVPAARQQKGFAGYIVLGDRGKGKAITISLWETQADREASGSGSEYYNEVIAMITPFLTAEPIAEDLEVLFQT